MATAAENLERFQEIKRRGIQDRLSPEIRARFDEAERRGLLGEFGQLPNPTGEVTSDDPNLAQNLSRAAVKGSTELLGFPAEAALGIARGGAFLAGEEPIVGGVDLRDLDPTQAIQDIVGAVGLRSDPQPEGMLERGATNITEALSSGFTGLGLARGTTGRAGQALRKRFGRFAKEEVAAGTVGAAARTLSEEAGFGAGADAGSEFFGNLIAGTMASRLSTARDAFEGLGEIGKKMSRRQRKKAARILQDFVREGGEDPAELARRIRADDTLGARFLTPGTRADSVALQELESALIKKNPDVFARFAQNKTDVRQFVTDELTNAIGGEGGASQDFIDWYVRSNRYASDLMESALQSAISDQMRLTRDLPPINADFASPFRGRMENLKRIDRDIERAMWDFASDARLPPRPMKKALDEVMSEAGLIDEADQFQRFPSAAIRGTIDEMDKAGAVSVDELLKLRSSILDDAAEASANTQPNLARRLNNLADGVMDTLDELQDIDPEVAESIRQARQYSLDFNDRWSRDVIGPLLAQSARRGKMVPDNETMTKLWRGGEAGRTSMRAVNEAAGGTPEEVRQFVLQELMRDTVGEAGMDPVKIENFINRFRPSLEETGMMDTVSAFLVGARRVKDADVALKSFTDSSNLDAAAQVLGRGSTGDDLVSFIRGSITAESKNLQATLTDLFASANRNLTGEATEGLKAATWQAVLDTMYKMDGDPTTVMPRLRVRVRNALTATGQFSEDQVERIDELMDLAARSTAVERKKAFKTQSNTPQDIAAGNALGRLFRWGFLRFGSKVITPGPASLAQAGMLGSLGDRIGRTITDVDAESLLRALPFDDKLMIALLEDPDTMTAGSKSIIRSFLGATADFVEKTAAGGVKPSLAGVRLEEEEQ